MYQSIPNAIRLKAGHTVNNNIVPEKTDNFINEKSYHFAFFANLSVHFSKNIFTSPLFFFKKRGYLNPADLEVKEP